MECLCVGSSCIAREGGRLRAGYCLDCPRRIRASDVVGFLPDLTDNDTVVVVLHRYPPGYYGLALRIGAWELPLPTRDPILEKDYVFIFSVMTEPAPRPIQRTLLEARIPEEEKIQLIGELERIYDGLQDVVVVNVEKALKNGVPTGLFNVYTDDRRKLVILDFG